MGDYPATWRCRRSQGSSDGQRCHTVVEIRLTSRTIGSLRLGPAQVSDGSQRQGRQARQASKASEASIVVKPEAATRTEGGARDPVLRHRRAAAPSPAWPRGSPRPHGDAWHCADVRRGTARPLWHDRSLRRRRQPAGERWRRSSTWDRGPVRPGKGTQIPDTIRCPQCGAPAWITARFRLGSTDGSVEHLKTGCVNNHWLTLLAEMVERERPAALGRDLAAVSS